MYNTQTSPFSFGHICLCYNTAAFIIVRYKYIGRVFAAGIFGIATDELNCLIGHKILSLRF